jgi:hypothetical protein
MARRGVKMGMHATRIHTRSVLTGYMLGNLTQKRAVVEGSDLSTEPGRIKQ